MTRVAVLHGGISAEREVSLRSGQQVVIALTAAGFASWIAKGGLKYGIDFTGGANITVQFGMMRSLPRASFWASVAM